MEIYEIQQSLLGLYTALAKICDKHNINYYVMGGGTLGAIRHNGFIPWDDDLDVGIPRDDYNRFLKYAEYELPDNMKVYCMDRLQIAILMDMDTEAKYDEQVQSMFVDGIQEHIHIDLMPLDGVPGQPIKRWIHCLNEFKCRAVYKLCDSDRVYTASWRLGWQNTLISLWKKIHLGKLFSEKKAFDKWIRCMKKYSYQESDWIADFVGKYPTKDVYPKSWFEPGMTHKFENITVRIPNDFDSYLTQLYGNYMEIPKEHESHIRG